MRTPNLVRKELRAIAANYVGGQITKAKVGAMIGRMNEMLGGDENRYKVMGWLFRGDGQLLHRKDTEVHEWLALYNWFGFWQEDGVWKVSPEFELEIRNILKYISQEKDVKN